MDVSRRDVLRLLGTTGMVLGGVRSSLAAFGSAAGTGSAVLPEMFAAYATQDRQSFGLGPLAETGEPLWRSVAEARLHGGSVRPGAAEIAVAARRPGAFALIVDARTGARVKMVPAAEGRYFLGHAVYSPDGLWLYTTEAISETSGGLVGVYDVQKGYVRTAEWPTGGPDPHELVLSEDGRTLWVANGGIELSPETGRAVLNEGGIRSSVVRLGSGGRTVDQLDLGTDLATLSIRHIALAGDGALLFACQEQGDVAEARPLVGRAGRDGGIELLSDDAAPWHAVNGYLGSIAADSAGKILATTSPRGNVVWFQSIAEPSRNWRLAVDDVCGVAPLAEAGRFLLTSGTGAVMEVEAAGFEPRILSQSYTEVRWDNHVIRGAAFARHAAR